MLQPSIEVPITTEQILEERASLEAESSSLRTEIGRHGENLSRILDAGYSLAIAAASLFLVRGGNVWIGLFFLILPSITLSFSLYSKFSGKTLSFMLGAHFFAVAPPTVAAFPILALGWQDKDFIAMQAIPLAVPVLVINCIMLLGVACVDGRKDKVSQLLYKCENQLSKLESVSHSKWCETFLEWVENYPEVKAYMVSVSNQERFLTHAEVAYLQRWVREKEAAASREAKMQAEQAACLKLRQTLLAAESAG